MGKLPEDAKNNFVYPKVPTTMDAFMCYGPVVSDGYGVCYNPHPSWILVCITSFKRHNDTNSDHFAYTLESSFLQMQELCLKTCEAKPILSGGKSHSENRNGAIVEDKEISSGTKKSRLVRQRTTPFPEVIGKDS